MTGLEIVIVEDDWIEASFLRETLEKEFKACKITVISTELAFKDALPGLRKKPPAVVVLDMYLRYADPPEKRKGVHGFFRAGKRCQELLAADPKTANVPIIYYTVVGRDDILMMGPLPENVSFSAKTSEPFDIVRKIRSILAAQVKPAKPRKKSMRDQVFISYSHKDKRFLDDLLVHLKPLERAGRVKAWSDRQIQTGSTWFEEIKKSLDSAKVAVMMVTPSFLASDFINEFELGPMLKEAEAGGVRIVWIPVRACSYKETALKDLQSVIPPDKPLAEMKADRDKAWVKIVAEIKAAADGK